MSPKLSTNRTIAKNAVYLYIRMFFVMALSLVSVRLLLKNLGVVDYGVYNAIGGVVASLSFLSNVLSSASQRFFSYGLGKGNIEELKDTFCTIMFVYFGLALFIFLILQFGGMWFVKNKMTIPVDRLKSAEIVLLFSTLSFLVGVIAHPFPALIIAHENMSLYAILSVLDAIMKFSAALCLVLPMESKLETYAFLLFLVSCVYACINIVICYKKYPESHLKFHIDTKQLKSIFGFSGWTLFGSVANIGYTQGLNILFNVFIGPLANAAYAIGNQVSVAVNSLGAGFFSAMRPAIIKSIATSEFHYTNRLFSLSNKITFFLLSAISIPILVNTEVVLSLWLGEIHDYMIPFVRIMLLSVLVQNLGMALTTIAQGANKVREYHLYVDGFTLLCLLVVYSILKLGGSPELVLSISVIVFIIAHFIRLLVVKKVLSFSIGQYVVKFFVPAVTIFLITIIICRVLLLLIVNKILAFIISSLFSTVILSVLVYCVLFTRAERLKVMTLIKGKLHLSSPHVD